MPAGRTETVVAMRFVGRERARRPQELVAEEPLEIRLDGAPVSTTMRTPGNDFELAAGRLWADGLLTGPPAALRYCATASASSTHFNVVSVLSAVPSPAPLPQFGAPRGAGEESTAAAPRGADLVEHLAGRVGRVEPADWTVEAMAALGDALVERQELFCRTGGAHGAAAFDAEGDLVLVREDVGRHNAVDKVVGRLLLDGRLPVPGWALWSSGRVSFQMVQKAWAAGFGALVSVSAPSSLAVNAAARAGMVLVGFARDGSGTLYTGDAR